MSSHPVEAHYSRPGLEQTILEAVRKSGKDQNQLTPRDLAPVDEFHIGGLEATEELASFMDLGSGMRLLDVGCGIGGPARYFAGERHCHVTGVDLTEEFVRTAQLLTRLVGLEQAAEFRHASALELPFAAGTFDRAYMIHVGMNIPDKSSVFREVARVLVSGGRFAIFDLMQAADKPFAFPVPWAFAATNSAVGDLNSYRRDLLAAGFRVVHERNRTAFGIAFTTGVIERFAQQGPPALGLHLLMGEKTPLMIRNVLEALRSGALAPIEMVAEKP
jgi:SAM-dependent methyltransferase